MMSEEFAMFYGNPWNLMQTREAVTTRGRRAHVGDISEMDARRIVTTLVEQNMAIDVLVPYLDISSPSDHVFREAVRRLKDAAYRQYLAHHRIPLTTVLYARGWNTLGTDKKE